MITTVLQDALGREIEEGPAVYIDVGRGSITASKTYIVGTKGQRIVCLNTRWLSKRDTEDLIEAYRTNKLSEEDLKKVITTYVPTRIIMLHNI